MADENEPMPAARKRRRRPDIYDIRNIIRMAVVFSVGGAVTFGAVLGDIWLWRLLYG